MMDNRKLSFVVFFSYMLMSGFLLIQTMILGRSMITSPVIKVILFLFILVCAFWRSINKPKVRISAEVYLLVLLVFYTIVCSMLTPEYNYENLGYYSCLIIILIFSFSRSESIVGIKNKKLPKLELVVVSIFVVISLVSVCEQFNNSPLLSQYLGVPSVSGTHKIPGDDSLYVFYGWHNEAIPLINSSIGIFLRSVSIFPNGLDLGLFALYFYCYFSLKIIQKNSKTKKNMHNAFNVICLALSVLVIFGTHTRVIWVSLFFLVYYFSVLSLNKCSEKSIRVLLLLGIIAQIFFALFATIYSLSASSEDNVESVVARVTSWITAYQLISKDLSTLVFGTGVVESPANGLLLDNTFISITLYSGAVGLILYATHFVLLCKKTTDAIIKIIRYKNDKIYTCPMVLAGVPFMYILPISWFFNNYQQKIVVFYIFPIMVISFFRSSKASVEPNLEV